MMPPFVFGSYINKKTGRTYKATEVVTNATNDCDAEQMVYYWSDTGETYVRELKEFLEKFTLAH